MSMVPGKINFFTHRVSGVSSNIEQPKNMEFEVTEYCSQHNEDKFKIIDDPEIVEINRQDSKNISEIKNPYRWNAAIRANIESRAIEKYAAKISSAGFKPLDLDNNQRILIEIPTVQKIIDNGILDIKYFLSLNHDQSSAFQSILIKQNFSALVDANINPINFSILDRVHLLSDFNELKTNDWIFSEDDLIKIKLALKPNHQIQSNFEKESLEKMKPFFIQERLEKSNSIKF